MKETIPGWVDCCLHCGCDEGDKIGHDDTCSYGCNDKELEEYL